MGENRDCMLTIKLEPSVNMLEIFYNVQLDKHNNTRLHNILTKCKHQVGTIAVPSPLAAAAADAVADALAGMPGPCVAPDRLPPPAAKLLCCSCCFGLSCC